MNWYLSVLFLFSMLSLLNCQELSPSSSSFRCSKERLKSRMKKLFGGKGALSDFVFYDYADVRRYIETMGSPRNRTELASRQVITAKLRKPVEITLAKSLNFIANNKYVELITKWARRLENQIKREERKAKCTRQQRRRRRQRNRTSRNSKNNGYRRYTRKQRTLSHYYQRQRRYGVRRYSGRSDEENDENNRPLAQLEENEGKDNHLLAQNFHLKDTFHKYSPLDLEDIDFQRMRRSVPFDYTDSLICKPEGSPATTKKKVLLCATCTGTIDFGRNVIPQFANSIECENRKPNCLGGDGTCTQKVVYFSFQKLKPGTTNVWQEFEQPLNVTCECECIANSLLHTYFVGNSN